MIDAIETFNLGENKEDVVLGKDVANSPMRENILSSSPNFRSLPITINEGIRPSTKFKSLGAIYPVEGGLNNLLSSDISQSETMHGEEIDVSIHSLDR